MPVLLSKYDPSGMAIVGSLVGDGVVGDAEGVSVGVLVGGVRLGAPVKTVGTGVKGSM